MENDYTKTPVEGFGVQHLLKMGWVDGRGIGKNPHGEISTYLKFKPREERIGLGSDKEKISKTKSEITIGSTVQVVSGKHSGISGIITEIQEKNVLIHIDNNKNILSVPITSIKLGKPKKHHEERPKKDTLKWVLPGLKIRVKNKHIQNGSLYNCKGVIEDVIDQTTFSAKIENKIINILCEKDIETLIPALSNKVLIVRGENKGEISKLISRDKKKNQVVVQLYDEILVLKQNDICDYMHE